jgi:hypothetical protein
LGYSYGKKEGFKMKQPVKKIENSIDSGSYLISVAKTLSNPVETEIALTQMLTLLQNLKSYNQFGHLLLLPENYRYTVKYGAPLNQTELKFKVYAKHRMLFNILDIVVNFVGEYKFYDEWECSKILEDKLNINHETVKILFNEKSYYGQPEITNKQHLNWIIKRVKNFIKQLRAIQDES